MNTHGRVTCPLPRCGYVREDYSDHSADGWILHLLLHIFYESTTLPDAVYPAKRAALAKEGDE
jgi:hypothetical protein